MAIHGRTFLYAQASIHIYLVIQLKWRIYTFEYIYEKVGSYCVQYLTLFLMLQKKLSEAMQDMRRIFRQHVCIWQDSFPRQNRPMWVDKISQKYNAVIEAVVVTVVYNVALGTVEWVVRETRTEQDCVFIFVLVLYPNLELVLKCNHA